MIYCGCDVFMGVISPYLPDNEVISCLRQMFDRDEQYSVDFQYWLSTARVVREGVLVDVMSRKFLLDYHTGAVIREVTGDYGCGGCKI